MMIGSVAATDTASNDTITTQTTSDSVAQATSTSTNTVDTTTTSDSSENSKSISKVSSTQTTENSVKSSSSSADSTLTKQSSTKTTVNNLTTTRNSKVTFKAVVTTNNGNYVQNGTVTFKINGKTIGKATVSNGGAKLTYKIPSTWTDINYKITAVYAGNDYYSKSTSNTGVLKLKSNLTTKVSVSDVTSVQGDKVTIKAVITTSDGTYVKTGKVAFKVNGKTIGTSTVSNGGAKITYTIPSSWKDSKYTITVVYGRNDYYKSSTGTGTLKLTAKVNPKVVINTTSATSGQSKTLITTITDASGNLVNGGKVAFKINGKTIGTATVSKGVAKLNYTIPSSWNGDYKITVVYGGYSKYNSNTETATLTVEKPVKPKISIDTTSVIAGESTTLKATITDASGNKVSGGKAAFKLNGKTIGTVSVSNGVAKLTYKIASSWNGNYNITVVYGGSGKYLKNSKTVTLTVNKKGSYSVPSGYESYVKETKNCEVSNTAIKNLAASLTSGVSSAYSAAVKIFNYVRDYVSYSSYYDTRYGAVGTLNRKYGNCVDQSHLLIALCRAVNIPARYCHATCSFRSGLVTGHVWAEVYVNGKWYKCDTTSRSNSFNNIVNWYSSTTVKRYTSCAF